VLLMLLHTSLMGTTQQRQQMAAQADAGGLAGDEAPAGQWAGVPGMVVMRQQLKRPTNMTLQQRQQQRQLQACMLTMRSTQLRTQCRSCGFQCASQHQEQTVLESRCCAGLLLSRKMLTWQLSQQQQAAAQQQRLQEQLLLLLQEQQQQVEWRVLAGAGVSAGDAGQREGGSSSSRMAMEWITWMDRNMQQQHTVRTVPQQQQQQQQQGVVQGVAGAEMVAAVGGVAA
jgi:hypothetical protein